MVYRVPNAIPDRVCIDNFGPFPAYVRTDTRWNGWAICGFEWTTVDHMIDVTTANNASNLIQADDLMWDTDGITLLKVSDTYNADGDLLYGPGTWVRRQNMIGTPAIERIEPDSNGLYWVGSHEWCWEECE